MRIVTASAVVAGILAVSSGVAHPRKTTNRVSAPYFGAPQRIGYRSGDDWEPATIADRAGHLYVAFAHAAPSAERKGTYHTRMLVQRSDDGGATWNAPVPIAPPAPRHSEGQFDPWFALAPDGATLTIGFLQGYPHAPVEVATSNDFGTTWSAPRSVSRLSPPLDKVVLVSRGPVMAVAYTDYRSHMIASVSLDSGTTWTTHIISRVPGLSGSSQMLVSGGGIDSRRNMYFTWDATWKPNRRPAPAVVWITKSRDLGVTWSETQIGESGLPPPCEHCQDAKFFAPQLTMAIGSDDMLYLAWNATRPAEKNRNGASERVYLVTSHDNGATFSRPQDVSDAPLPATHCFPALVAGANSGDVRIAWMDTRSTRWNVYYRFSTDGARTFNRHSIQLSSSNAANFGIPYGDYMQLAVDGSGLTHAAWGEDDDQRNPGNIWVANQTR